MLKKWKIKKTTDVKGEKCLNCDHEFINAENFCPECGQVNDVRRLSLKVFLHTMLAGFYSFDTRFLRTIVPLLFKPGKVSKEYIEGKRTFYNNPFQLLLQTAIVFFLVIGIIKTIKNFNSYRNNAVFEESITNDTLPILELNSEDRYEIYYKSYLDSVFIKDKLPLKFNDPIFSKEKKDSIFELIHTYGIRYQFKDYNPKKYVVSNEKIDSFNIHFLHTAVFLESYFKSKNIKYKIEENYYKDIQGIMKDTVFSRIGFSNISRIVDFARRNEKLPVIEALDSLNIEQTKSNIFWYQKAQDLNKLIYNEEYRHSYLDGIISKTTLALFLLLPLFTLIMTLLYFTSKLTYTENLVVVFNIQTVFLIILLISILLYNLFEFRLPIVLLNFGFVFYFYKTLRVIYKQGRFLTLIKLILLNIFFGLLSLIGFLMISFLVFLF